MKRAPFLVAALFILTACGVGGVEPAPRSGASGPPPDDIRTIQLPQEAPCTINVDGFGAVNIEDDYVANVVACENGNAPMEALKAQAIQARGYLYYVMLITGQTSIGNSQSDQVYDCSYTNAGPRHFEAARATRGQFLSWDDQVIAPFYVAGAIPANQSSGTPEDACQGAGGNDPTTTEQWVTYNQGLSSCNITMTPLGWVPDDGDCTRNPQNRGCASQNGQACLAARGWFYEEMQTYYYGEDIRIQQATGSCGGASSDPPNYDAYCMNHDLDAYCVNPSQRVICDGDSAEAVEDCTQGCFLGECQGDLEDETYCETNPDGWSCLDSSTRVLCEDDEMEATETCTAGCENDQCVPEGDGDGDTDTGGDGDGDPDAGGDADGEPDSEGDADESHNPGDERVGDLITTSPGISGGCSQAPTGPGGAPLTLFLGLLIIAGALRRRR